MRSVGGGDVAPQEVEEALQQGWIQVREPRVSHRLSLLTDPKLPPKGA